MVEQATQQWRHFQAKDASVPAVFQSPQAPKSHGLRCSGDKDGGVDLSETVAAARDVWAEKGVWLGTELPKVGESCHR